MSILDGIFFLILCVCVIVIIALVWKKSGNKGLKIGLLVGFSTLGLFFLLGTVIIAVKDKERDGSDVWNGLKRFFKWPSLLKKAPAPIEDVV